MIVYSDIDRFDRVPFDQYLLLPGNSHSAMRNEFMGVQKNIQVSDSMRLGSMTDDILTSPHLVHMSSPFYRPAREIAIEIKKVFGAALPRLKTQVSYTALMSLEGITLKTKGRLDFLMEDFFVLDLKITKSSIRDLPSLIDFMGYKNQIWHYAKLSGVKKGYLIFYSRKDRKVAIREIDCSSNFNPFWAEKIINFGVVD